MAHMADIRTSVPFPTEPWKRARERFLEGLGPEDTERYKNATLENIFYDASLSQKYTAGTKGWMIQQRLASFSDGLEEYAKAMDVFVNSCPEILSPIWGSIRVVMLIASEAGKFQDMLVDMFAQIADVLPRLQIYEMIFKDHERVLRVVSDAYLDVVNFCIHAKHLFAKKSRSMIPLSITLRAVWKPFQKEFENYMVTFRGHRKRADREAKVAHMIEAAKSREITLRNKALQKRNYRLGRRHEILSDLTNINYSAKHGINLGLRQLGTNVWMGNDNKRLSLWLASQESKGICCYGIPGSGKSVLAASVIEDLLATIDGPTSIICYYYCDYADIASLDIVELVACLIKQVLIRLPLDRFDDDFDCPFRQGVRPGLRESQEFLLKILGEYTHTFIILDGLDELDKHNQTATMAFIEQLITIPDTVTKVFATSRPEENIIRNAFGDNSVDLLSLSFHNDSINQFIERYVEAKLPQTNTLLNNQRLRREVLESLVTCTKGMFLFVKLQLDEIEEAITENEIREVISDFPKGLDGIYIRILKKIKASPGGEAKLAMIRKAFRWIACARRPLTLQELEEAVGIDKMDKYLHVDRLAKNAGLRLISACGNLLTYDDTNGTVTFVHHSVLQFLCMDPIDTTGEYPHQMHFKIAEADHEIGEICIAYLSFSDFETQIATLPSNAQLDRGYAEKLIQVSHPLVRKAFAIATRLNPLGFRSRSPSPSPLNFSLPASSKASETLVNKYLLLEYIINYWTFHTRSFDPTESCWNAFSYHVVTRTLMFEFRPWNEDPWRKKIETLAAEYKTHFVRGSIKIGPKATWSFSTNLLEYLPIIFWAFKHGIRSLLLVVNDYTNCADSTYSWPLLPMGMSVAWPDLISCMLKCVKIQDGSQSFWNGQLILDMQNDRQTPSKAPRRFVRAALEEYGRYTGLKSPVLLQRMMEEAFLISIRRKELQAFNRLVDLDCEPDCPPVLQQVKKRVFTTMVREQCMWERGFYIATSIGSHGYPESKLEDLDFIFALERQLPFVAACLNKDYLGRCYANFELSTQEVCRIYALAMIADEDLYLSIMSMSIEYEQHLWGRHFTFQLPTHDWTRTSLGSVEAYQKMLAIDGFSLLEIALKAAYDEKPACPGPTEWALQIENILSRDKVKFSASKLEARGIHVMDWAMRSAPHLITHFIDGYYPIFDLEQESNIKLATQSFCFLVGGSDNGGTLIYSLWRTLEEHDQFVVTASALSILHQMMTFYSPKCGFPLVFNNIHWSRKAVKTFLQDLASEALTPSDRETLQLHLVDEEDSTQ